MCINFYRLERVAKLLGLAFDRSYTAEKIYRDLEAKQMVRFLKQDHQTFITFTKQGTAYARKKLNTMIELDSGMRVISVHNSRGWATAKIMRMKCGLSVELWNQALYTPEDKEIKEKFRWVLGEKWAQAQLDKDDVRGEIE